MLAVAALVTQSTQSSVLIPRPDEFSILGLNWTGAYEPFSDAQWTRSPAGGPNGVGFSPSGGSHYDDFIGVDLRGVMQSISTTALVRVPFTVASGDEIDLLRLGLRFDDGFIAWINGVEVARHNAPPGYPPRDNNAYPIVATAPNQAITVDISGHVSALRTGANVLAIRGFNAHANDDDFLLQPTLEATIYSPVSTAVDDTVTMRSDEPSIAIDVLQNDFAGSEPTDPATIQIVAAPANGTIDVDFETGIVTYAPATGFSGTDSLRYRVGSGFPESAIVVPTNAQHQRLIPVAASAGFGLSWTGGNEPFNATGWTTATGGLGFDPNATPVDFRPYFGDNVQAMQGVNGSVYMRVPFSISNAADIRQLRLNLRVDDGFIAYVNGVRVAALNAPSTPVWNSIATASSSDSDAITQREFVIPIDGIPLRSAQNSNILAIHGLNAGASSTDFLIEPELIADFGPIGPWSNEASVTFNVLEAWPLAVDDSATTVGATPVAISVLSNDRSGAAPNDFALRPASVRVVTPPANGSATIDKQTGQITYQAIPGFSGQDTFQYTVNDSSPIGGELEPIAILPRGSVWKYLDNGSDQGTAWRKSTFDDTTWKSGRAKLGYGAGDFGTVVGYGPSSENKYITTYFRTTFQLEDPAAIQALEILAEYDDGIVVYINGVEVRRAGMPSGLLSAQTRASGNASAGFEVLAILQAGQLQMLRAGENDVAVEVHQSSPTSSDIALDLELIATLPSPVGYESDPATVTVTVSPSNKPPTAEDDAAVTRYGRAVEIDLLANDVAGGAFIDPATLEILTAPQNGDLQLLSNGRVMYTPRLTFVGDAAFTYSVRDASFGRESNVANVTIRVASSILAAHADAYNMEEDDELLVPAAFGVVANDTDDGGSIVSASLVSSPSHGTLILFGDGAFRYRPFANFNGEDAFRYRVLDNQGATAEGEVTIQVVGVSDAPTATDDVFQVPSNGELEITALITESAPLVPAQSTWRYFDQGLLQGSAWRNVVFGDASWQEGPAQLGYGEGDEATVLNYGPDSSQRYVTTYFRRSFFVNDYSAIHNLYIDLLRDDGAIIYLNGSAVISSNMPSNSTENSVALEPVDGEAERTFITFPVGVSAATPGLNVIAVEVHQSSAYSSDLSFDLRVRADVARAVNDGALLNDQDVDGDLLTATLVSGPTNGTLDFDANGGFRYKPNPGFAGEDSFSYRAFDGQLQSNLATVSLTVQSTTGPAADLDGDGVVNLQDLAVLVQTFGETDSLSGGSDLDGDGEIGIADAIVMRNSMSAAGFADAVVAHRPEVPIIAEKSQRRMLRASRQIRAVTNARTDTSATAADRVLAGYSENLVRIADRRHLGTRQAET